MILDHVARRARFLVIAAAPFHANRFRRCDLHVVHVAAIPQRLKNSVAEAKRQYVLHRLFAQVMVNAIHLGFPKHAVNPIIQLAGAGEIVAKGFFHDDPLPTIACTAPQAGRSQALDGFSVIARLRRQIVKDVRMPQLCQLVLQPGVERWIAHIARKVTQILREPGPLVLVKRTVFEELLHGVVHHRAKSVIAQRRARRAHDLHTGRQPPLDGQAVQRRQKLSFGEIARGAKDYDRAFRRASFKPQGVGKRVGSGHSDSP